MSTANTRPASPPGASAPYGRACVECSQSKCKCILRRGGGRCERCYRLNKECRPSVSVRRRNPRKQNATKVAMLEEKLDRTAKLEEKLDGLMSMLKTGAQSGAIAADSETTAAMYDFAQETEAGLGDGNVSLVGTLPTRPGSASMISDSSVTSPSLASGPSLSDVSSVNSPASVTQEYLGPSPAVADECLNTFTTYMSKCFPFIYLSPGVTAQQLRQERPFLWLCIMAVSSKSASQQQMLGDQIRHRLAQELLLKSTKSVDILQGLLTFVGWYNCQMQSASKASLTLFTQLAMSVVFDLGINKPLPADPKNSIGCIGGTQSPKATNRTMEERRAALACFLVTSIISSFLQKIDALRWTPHLEECVQVLQEQAECPEDEILVQQVRLQQLVEKVNQSMSHDGALDAATHTKVPPAFYIQALHTQLQEIKSKFSPPAQQDAVLALHVHATELSINELALSPSLSAATSASADLSLRQTQTLFACVESLKSWFETFFSIPPDRYVGFPFSIFSQLVRCLTLLFKLATLDDPAWDKAAMRCILDPLTILDNTTVSLEQASAMAGLNQNDGLLSSSASGAAAGGVEGDRFTRSAKLFRSLRPTWEAKLALQQPAAATSAQQQQAQMEGLAGNGTLPDAVEAGMGAFGGVPTQPVTTAGMSAEDLQLSADALPVDFSNDGWLMDFLMAPS